MINTKRRLAGIGEKRYGKQDSSTDHPHRPPEKGDFRGNLRGKRPDPVPGGQKAGAPIHHRKCRQAGTAGLAYAEFGEGGGIVRRLGRKRLSPIAGCCVVRRSSFPRTPSILDLEVTLTAPGLPPGEPGRA